MDAPSTRKRGASTSRRAVFASKCPNQSLSVRASRYVPIRINLAGSATVKHVVRQGAKYVLGLELSQVLRDQVLARIREPWAFRKPASVV